MERALKQLASLLGVALVVGCVHSREPALSASSLTPLSERDSIFFTVFESLLSIPDPGVQWFFLGVPKRTDPSPQLQAALQSYRGVAPLSAMTFVMRPEHRLYDGRGALLQLGEIEWIDSAHVKLEASYAYGMSGGQGWRFTLKKVKDRWHVTSREATWES
jgi:hypothetical protein